MPYVDGNALRAAKQAGSFWTAEQLLDVEEDFMFWSQLKAELQLAECVLCQLLTVGRILF